MFQWLKNLVLRAKGEAPSPEFGLQGLPVHINLNRQSRTAVLRHLERIRGLNERIADRKTPRERVPAMAAEVARRKQELAACEIPVPSNIKALNALIERVKASG